MSDNYLTKLFINEAKPALERHSGGGSKPPVVEALSVTENGTYTPPEGVDGYAPVEVDVPPTVVDSPIVLDSARYFFYNGMRLALLDRIDTSSCSDFSSMFACSRPSTSTGSDTVIYINSIPNINTSKATKMISMFNNCSRLTSVPDLDTSMVTTMSSMFLGCASLTSVPDLDTSMVTDMVGMFSGCSSLTSVPDLDTSMVTDMQKMFYQCKKMISAPALKFDNVSAVGEMFSGCSSLTSVPNPKSGIFPIGGKMFYECTVLKQLPDQMRVIGHSMNSTFYGCKALEHIAIIGTSKADSHYQTFYSCAVLHTITGLDLNMATIQSSMFSGCAALENLTLYNIRKSLTIGSGTSWGHLLTVDSLVHTIKELCAVTSTQTLTMGSANTAKIADLYCKITDDTSEKKPMELCESSDEGAMTLTAYALYKGWNIA